MAPRVPTQPAACLVLATAIDAQRQALLQALGAEGKVKPKQVHDLRVACRRLLVSLELASSAGYANKPRATRRLRKLLDELSPLRDTHVQLRTLAPLLLQYEQAEELAERLRAQKGSLEQDAQARLEKFRAKALTRDLAQVTEALAAVPADFAVTSAIDAALRGRLAQQHLRISEAWEAATAEDPRSLHRLRVRLKQYRYSLDALAPVLPSAAQELTQRITRLQDQLGLAHDAHVLAETARDCAKARGLRHRRALKALAGDLDKTSRAAQQNSEASLRGTRLAWPLSA